jgi:hypothetical protein
MASLSSFFLVWLSQPSGLCDDSLSQGFRETAERTTGPLCAAAPHLPARLPVEVPRSCRWDSVFPEARIPVASGKRIATVWGTGMAGGTDLEEGGPLLAWYGGTLTQDEVEIDIDVNPRAGCG